MRTFEEKSMQKIAVRVLFLLTFYGIYLYFKHFTIYPEVGMVVLLVPVGIFFLNMSLRNKLAYKGWFLNRMNFFLEKETFKIETNLSFDLLVPKVREIVEQSDYKLLDQDDENQTYLLGTSVSLLSLGENIYIQPNCENGKCFIELVSITVFTSSSFGNSKRHFERMKSSFEYSLII